MIALTVMEPTMLVGFFASQAILSCTNLQIGFGHGGGARAVLGAALYLTVAGLLGLPRRHLSQHGSRGH